MTIYVDLHEPQYLKKRFTSVELKNGDIKIDTIVKSTGERKVILIERKTLTDFWNSQSKGRLHDQLTKVDMLLIDVSSGFTSIYIDTGSLYKSINTISIHTPVIFGVSSEEIVRTIVRYQQKIELGEWGTMRQPIITSRNPPIVRRLAAFDNVGPERAKALLKKFGTMRNVLNAIQMPTSLYGENIPKNIAKAVIDGINNGLDEGYREE